MISALFAEKNLCGKCGGTGSSEIKDEDPECCGYVWNLFTEEKCCSECSGYGMKGTDW